jgi:hypothetical protein
MPLSAPQCWRKQVILKRRYKSNRPHGVTFRKTSPWNPKTPNSYEQIKCHSTCRYHVVGDNIDFSVHELERGHKRAHFITISEMTQLRGLWLVTEVSACTCEAHAAARNFCIELHRQPKCFYASRVGVWVES